jgi:uncharacterized cofD-like protein
MSRRFVVIGGGHGAAASLRAVKSISEEPPGAIITVADNGGSSGALAVDFGVLPMGDIRNCLAALAPDSATVELMQHRFSSGSLENHVLGNLIVAAVVETTGSFMDGVTYLGELMGSRGSVLPPTLETVRLVAEAGGERIEGQVAVAQASGEISRVELDPPDPKAFPDAIDLIAAADVIVLGPGSLFTSVIPPLLVPDIAEAYVASKATKVYVCNLVAPPGETANFDATAHVQALENHVGSSPVIDICIAHAGRKPATDAPVVDVDEPELAALGVRSVTADLIPASGAARHDPERLGSAIANIVK